MSVTKSQVRNVLSALAKELSDNDEALKAIELLNSLVEENNLFKNNKAVKSALDGNFPLTEELKKDPEAYAVFSDGACRGNPGPGAWGLLAQNAKGEILFESNGLDLMTTNNKMELEGAIQSLERLLEFWEEKNLKPSTVYLYSDSKYVIEGVSKWLIGWKNRGWKKADGKAPENLELWQHFDYVTSKFFNINYVWVKGHAGHPQNEHCDKLANMALDQSGY